MKVKSPMNKDEILPLSPILIWLVKEVIILLLGSVLESILSGEACKNGLPTVAGLLTHPFFNQVRGNIGLG